MLDKYNRIINYLRISVTDRCNLRCIYCMPDKGIKLKDHNDILTYEEIIDFIKVATQFGINKVRITGGEPLVRKGIENLISKLSMIDGIEDLCMTTNGILLTEYAVKLKNAGLMRLNISLDTLDKEKFRQITRGGDLNKITEGIKVALNTGFKEIKINTVFDDSTTKTELEEIKTFGEKNNINVRFIKRMDLKKGQFWVIEGGDGGDCLKCNRIRLTADGFVRPCLFSDEKFSIKEFGYEKALLKAISAKPERGNKCSSENFYSIGG